MDYLAIRSDQGTWKVAAWIVNESPDSIEVAWEHGEADTVPLPLPETMRIWRRGSLAHRFQTEPAELAREFATDPTGLLGQVLREEGPVLHRKELRSRAVELGLPEALFAGDKSWWTKQYSALLKLPDIVEGLEKFTLCWSPSDAPEGAAPDAVPSSNASRSRSTGDRTGGNKKAADRLPQPDRKLDGQNEALLDEIKRLERKLLLLESEVSAVRKALDEERAAASRDREAATARIADATRQIQVADSALADHAVRAAADRDAAELARRELAAVSARADALENELRAAQAAGSAPSLALVRQARIDVARVLCSVLADIARDTVTFGAQVPEMNSLYQRALARAAQAGVRAVGDVGSVLEFDPALHRGPKPLSGRARVGLPGFSYQDGDESLILEYVAVHELTE